MRVANVTMRVLKASTTSTSVFETSTWSLASVDRAAASASASVGRSAGRVGASGVAHLAGSGHDRSGAHGDTAQAIDALPAGADAHVVVPSGDEAQLASLPARYIDHDRMPECWSV